MYHERAKLFAATFLSAGAFLLSGMSGVCRGELVPAAQADAVTPFVAPTSFRIVTPDPVARFLNSPAVPDELNRSPREVLHEPPSISPPVESQMVPLPPGVWTGFSGLFGLGLFRVAKRVRKTFP
jgi:hypothetical protein